MIPVLIDDTLIFSSALMRLIDSLFKTTSTSIDFN